MVTHLSTDQPVHCLNMAERTGSLVFSVLWSYVKGEVDSCVQISTYLTVYLANEKAQFIHPPCANFHSWPRNESGKVAQRFELRNYSAKWSPLHPLTLGLKAAGAMEAESWAAHDYSGSSDPIGGRLEHSGL